MTSSTHINSSTPLIETQRQPPVNVNTAVSDTVVRNVQKIEYQEPKNRILNTLA